MSDIAIRVENVSKRYIVGELVTTQDLKRWLTAPLRALGLGRDGRAPPAHAERGPPAPAGSLVGRRIARHEFWALKDVSFEVKRGEVLGIIGANGAGKSTLLKILSRITAPTRGRAELYGRVASLLEVGTGFHPELTGRENIYLNGSILGMTKREVDRKFDEIVDFAGVEEFIDTPIKRYSSGMKVRLGFAVAAHLDPEILLIDEVLAVGDVGFQKKCLGKMEDVARSGRTVLFVSHNMAAISSLCLRSLVFVGGTLSFDGEPTDAISHYLRLFSAKAPERNVLARSADGTVELVEVRYLDADGHPVPRPMAGRPLSIELVFNTRRRIRRAEIAIGIDDPHGSRVALLANALTGEAADLVPPAIVVHCTIPEVPLVPRTYTITVQVSDKGSILLFAPNVVGLPVEGGDFLGSGHLPDPRWAGNCLIKQRWH